GRRRADAEGDPRRRRVPLRLARRARPPRLRLRRQGDPPGAHPARGGGGRGDRLRRAPRRRRGRAGAQLLAPARRRAGRRPHPAPVAVALPHTFSLWQDDVMDGDLPRRHRPTAWSVFGANAAVLAGDALLPAAFEALADEPSPAVPRAVRILGRAVLDLVAGQ